MKISQLIKTEVTQQGLDFIDIDLSKDTPLYIDPYLISLSETEFAIEVSSKIKSFFCSFKNAVIANEIEKIEYLFSQMSEPKETYLGVSKKKSRNGKGIGPKNSEELTKWIIDSKAIQSGVVKNIEDLALFVENIDKDKISDMVTNIIRLELLKYTKDQCGYWNLKTTVIESLPFWDATREKWVIADYPHLIIEGYVVLLVPKNFVSSFSEYNFNKYEWYHVISPEKVAMLRRKDSLAKLVTKANGEKRYELSKVEVKDYIGKKVDSGEYISRKDFARKYTLEHPEVFSEFIFKTRNNVKPLNNKAFEAYVDTASLDDLIFVMIEKLKAINTGNKEANLYHHYVKCLIEILWYPYLVNPIIEQEIHDGRKRIDIVIRNNDQSSFFYKLNVIAKVNCPYIYLECKNYGKDVKNPELDQLSGRFSVMRGQFGILLCRDIKNEDLFIKRCQDTYKDQRGLIIHITDRDIIYMLQCFARNNIEEMWDLLEEKKMKVMIG